MKDKEKKKNLLQPAEQSNNFAPGETGEMDSDKKSGGDNSRGMEGEEARKNADRVARDRVAPKKD